MTRAAGQEASRIKDATLISRPDRLPDLHQRMAAGIRPGSRDWPRQSARYGVQAVQPPIQGETRGSKRATSGISPFRSSARRERKADWTCRTHGPRAAHGLIACTPVRRAAAVARSAHERLGSVTPRQHRERVVRHIEADARARWAVPVSGREQLWQPRARCPRSAVRQQSARDPATRRRRCHLDHRLRYRAAAPAARRAATLKIAGPRTRAPPGDIRQRLMRRTGAPRRRIKLGRLFGRRDQSRRRRGTSGSVGRPAACDSMGMPCLAARRCRRPLAARATAVASSQQSSLQ